MQRISWRKILVLGGALVGLWLGTKYLLPVLIPFGLGTLLALAAEPAVRFSTQKLHFPRLLASGVSVTVTLALLAGILSLVGALAVKELGHLAGTLPDAQQTLQQGITLLQDWLVEQAARLPDSLGNLVTGTVLEFFDSGSALLHQLTGRVPKLLGTVLGWLPDGALGLGTGILSGYMISVRLPQLKTAIRSRLPQKLINTYLPALRRVRKTLGQWLKAQGKLLLVTYGVVSAGFLLLGISNGLLWAVLVALIDAVPVLGTGTVLIPWALVEMLRGNAMRALGLGAVYLTALLGRVILEPRLLGRHLGLDPLMTLLFLYVGYRFWGILGMIFAPMAAAAAKSLTETLP